MSGGRLKGSILWLSITIPPPIARGIAHFLYTCEYPEHFDSVEQGERWRRLQNAYERIPDDDPYRSALPEIHWPSVLTHEEIQRVKNILTLYRAEPPASRQQLLDALTERGHGGTPLGDVELFGVSSQTSRTSDLFAPRAPATAARSSTRKPRPSKARRPRAEQ